MKTVWSKEPDAKPKGFKWCAHYVVRFDDGGLRTGSRQSSSLTEARKTARVILSHGKKWAEIFRLAETGAARTFVYVGSLEVKE